MKNLFLAIFIIAPTLTYADFDAGQALASGLELSKKKIDAIYSTPDISDSISAGIDKLSNDLLSKSETVSNTNLRKIIQDCATDFEQSKEDLKNEWVEHYSSRKKGNTQYKVSLLKTLVTDYGYAEECVGSNCIGNFSEMEREINNILSDFATPVRFTDIEKDIYIRHENICDVSTLFDYEYTLKHKEIIQRRFYDDTANLTGKDLLNAEVLEALEVIAENAPIVVKAKASIFGNPRMSFSRNVLTLTSVYDNNFITGIENVLNPETNPVKAFIKVRK